MKKFIAVLTLTAAPGTVPAFARESPGVRVFGLYQRGCVVGEIYVPARDLAVEPYVEHWVLFSGYAPPGDDPRLDLEARPAPARYRDEEDFFRNVRRGPGAQYVRVDAPILRAA